MCTLLEPVMLAGLASAVVAPFAAAFVFGVDAGLSLHYLRMLVEIWAGGLIAVPLLLAAVVFALYLPVRLVIGFARALL